jgi:hypothetical protein
VVLVSLKTREKAGETTRSMATSTLVTGDLPEGSGSPAMDLMWLLRGEGRQVSGKRDGSK